MATAYIAIGSNLGDRAQFIQTAIRLLRAVPGVTAVHPSPLHETQPVGGPPGQGLYLNGAARVDTTLGPEALHAALQQVEQVMGRIRGERWGPRTIDLDLLLYEQVVFDTPELTVPHPRMHQRRFVLDPLVEIAPDAIHPVFAASVAQLKARLDADMS